MGYYEVFKRVETPYVTSLQSKNNPGANPSSLIQDNL